MAGVSEKPFRRLARKMGASAAPTELVSAKGLLYGQTRTQQYLDHDADEDPFWVQLFGGEADAMVAGGRRAVELGAKILDINMGCPVRKVTRHGAGSGLLCDPPRAAQLVAAMVRELGVPVTVKIRAGWDAHSLNYREMADRLADAGCSALAMHARTRAQAYSGHANWDLIADLVAHAKVPVIGNGDAFTAQDARRMLAQTGCAAVMVGRGALGNPWIFAELARPHQAPPTAEERWLLIAAHLAAHVAHVGDVTRAVRRFRPHLMWYARGLTGAAKFRSAITQIEDLAELEDACARFFLSAQRDALEEPAEFELSNALG